MSAIFVDSHCDLDVASIKKLNLNMVELGSNYAQDFMRAFEPYLREQEDILYFATNLSDVKNCFDEVVNKCKFSYNKREIKCVDLGLSSVCAGLVAYEIGVMYKRGLTDLEIINFANNFKKDVYAMLICNNKDFIKSNCKNLDKININSTSDLILPLIFVHGKNYEIIDKSQGKKKGITMLVNMAKEYCVNMADYPMIIGYGDDEANAEYLKNSLITQLGEDAIIMLQKLSNNSIQSLGKNAIIVSFYSKKIRV